jgi:general stress protein 26
MSNHTEKSESIARLGELIKDIRIAMLTTVDDDGGLRSRPMATQDEQFDGELWFFTQASSPKGNDIASDHQVNVAYAAPDKQRYISISGRARLVRDKAKMKQLWSPILKAWFPEGLNDPDLALLQISAERAEYWDDSHSKVGNLIELVKALATGKEAEMGENRKIDLSH